MPIVDLTYALIPATPVFPNYPSVAVTLLEPVGQVTLDGRRALNSTVAPMSMHQPTA